MHPLLIPALSLCTPLLFFVVFAQNATSQNASLYVIGEEYLNKPEVVSEQDFHVIGKRSPLIVGKDTSATDTTAAPAASSATAAAATTAAATTAATSTTSAAVAATGTSSASASKVTGIFLMNPPITRNGNNLYYYAQGSVANMSWVCNGAIAPSAVNIAVQRLGGINGGGGQLEIVSPNNGGAAASSTFNWTIPTNQTAGEYMVFVEDVNNPTISNTTQLSKAGYCQAYSPYNPYLMYIYKPLNAESLIPLVAAGFSVSWSLLVILGLGLLNLVYCFL